MNNSDITKYSNSFLLTAGESNAEGIMPLTLLVEQIIKVATDHANALGIGYSTLIKQNAGWVLSRVSVEMSHYPTINEQYTLTTWIESTNQYFSLRNFAITSESGDILGYARTVWVAIDFTNRRMANLALFDMSRFPSADHPCPIAPTPQIKALAEDAVEIDYTFKYCDIDFNRHVNTVRYIELLMNYWSLEHFDKQFPTRFDILFRHECTFGQHVKLRVQHDEAENKDYCEIVSDDDTRAISASFKWQTLS